MPVWPVATNAASHACTTEPGGDFDACHHLADAAIIGDRVDAQALGANASAASHIVLVVATNVDQFHAMPRGRLAEIDVINEKVVQTGDDRQFCVRSHPG